MASLQITEEQQRSIALKKVESTVNKYVETKSQRAYIDYEKTVKAAEKFIQPGNESDFEKLSRLKDRVQAVVDINWVMNKSNPDPSKSYQNIVDKKLMSKSYEGAMDEAWKGLTSEQKENFNVMVNLAGASVEKAQKKKAVIAVEKPEESVSKEARPKGKIFMKAIQSQKTEELETEKAREKYEDTIRQIMAKRGYDKAYLTISGAGAESAQSGTGSYNAILDLEGPNSKRLRIGFRGVMEKQAQQPEYVQTYEFALWGKDTQGKKVENEVWFKDLAAELTSAESVARFASFRRAVQKDNIDVLGYISAETGTGSYFYTKRDQAGNSASTQLTGGQNHFNVLYQKVSQDSEFAKYSGSIAVFQSMDGPYKIAKSIGNFVGDKPITLTFSKGDMIVSLTGTDEKDKAYSTHETYSGGTIKAYSKVGVETRLAFSPPYLEKTPDGKPEIFVVAYILRQSKKNGKMQEEYIGKTVLPILQDKLIGEEGMWAAAINVSPSKIALEPIAAELAKQSYNLHINEMAVSLVPSINPSYIYHSAKDGMDYNVTIKGITMQDPIISSTPRMFAEIEVMNQSKKPAETRIQKIELGMEDQILVGGGTLKIKAELPPYMTITMNPEKTTERLSLENTALTAQGDTVPKYIVQNIGYNRHSIDLPYIGSSAVGMNALFLSKEIPDLAKAAEEQREKASKGTRKGMEVAQERYADIGLVGTIANVDYQNALGLNFNAVNKEGHGVWGVAYNSLPLIESKVVSGGDALYQLTAKTKKVGWNSLGMSGATVFDKNTYQSEADKIDKLRFETGAALWHYFDTVALHGEAQSGGASIGERRSIGNTQLMAKGERLESRFGAWDRNRPGLQILTVNYNTEAVKGKEGGNTATVERSNLYYELGYNKETQNTLFRRMFGGLGVEDNREMWSNESALFAGGPMSLKQTAENTLSSWNPWIGFSGSKGAYRLNYRNATQDEMSHTEQVGGISDMKGQLKENAYQLTIGGLPLFGDKLTVDAQSSGRWTDQNVRTVNTLSNEVFTNTSDTRYEIKPVCKLSNGATAYLRLATQLTSSQSESFMQGAWQSRTTAKTSILNIDPGYKGRVWELNVNFMTEDNDTASEYLNRIQKTHLNQTRFGLTALGNIGKNTTFGSSVGVSSDNRGNKSWYFNSSLRLQFLGSKEKKK